MKEDDPRRLLDPRGDAPPLLREALSAARAVRPDADDLARLAAGLPLGRAPGGASPEGLSPSGLIAPLPSGPIAPPPSVLSGVLVGAALGALVSGVLLLRGGDTRPSLPPPAFSATTAPAGTSETRVAVAPPSTAPSASPEASVARPSLPVARAQVTSADPVSRPSSSFPEPVVVPEDESEVRLLARARDALDGAPADALSLTDRHAARFPGGVLAQEREVVAVRALVRLGRTSEARARAARFVAAFPGSAYRPGLEALFGP